jgi:hypothetical protein
MASSYARQADWSWLHEKAYEWRESGAIRDLGVPNVQVRLDQCDTW